jgi:hypothetical protein
MTVRVERAAWVAASAGVAWSSGTAVSAPTTTTSDAIRAPRRDRARQLTAPTLFAAIPPPKLPSPRNHSPGTFLILFDSADRGVSTAVSVGTRMTVGNVAPGYRVKTVMLAMLRRKTAPRRSDRWTPASFRMVPPDRGALLATESPLFRRTESPVVDQTVSQPPAAQFQGASS